MKRIGRIMWGAIIEVVKGFGKWLLYRSRLEGKVDMMMRRLIRLEIVSAIERKDTTTVCSLYDEYKLIGGNSYITHMVEEYIKKTTKKKK